jgi:hypothetical protein
MNKDDLTKDILQESLQDYVGLWSIARRLRSVGVTEDAEVRKAALAAINELLCEGHIVAGQFEGTRFQEWKTAPEQIIAKIEREWLELKRDPDIGEIAWFTASK